MSWRKSGREYWKKRIDFSKKLRIGKKKLKFLNSLPNMRNWLRLLKNYRIKNQLGKEKNRNRCKNSSKILILKKILSTNNSKNNRI